MAKVEDIGWGSYRNFEGPFHRGKHRYELPEEPTEVDKVLAVVTATEGGRYDAINMYDGQIISSGLIQFIERGQRSVSQMLGESLESDSLQRDSFLDFLVPQRVDLDEELPGKWYFMTGPGREVVDTLDEQRRLFHLRSTGAKGTWDVGSVAHAKKWAAAVASFWEHPATQKAQRELTLPQLEMFAFGDSRKMIKYASEKDTDLSEAFIAAYLSFAVNNPTRANKHLHIGLDKARMKSQACSEMWSLDWFIEILKELTFGPNIAIYPHRYNAIRPVMEKLYGIDLPDFADELKTWQRDNEFLWLPDTIEIQKALLALGSDLGPHGADGVYGRKTREAVFNFEQAHGHPSPDGYPDPYMVQLLERALQAKGMAQLGESS